MRAWLTHLLDSRSDHRAVFIAENSSHVIVATAALTSLGIPWVGIDPASAPDTISRQLQEVAPTLVLLDSQLPCLLDQPADQVVLDLRSSPIFGGSAADPPAPAPWPRQPFVAMGFTSGTTGTPKLFIRRSQTENQRVALLRQQQFGPDDSFLVTSPLAFASGHVWASAALALGASVRLCPAHPVTVIDVIAGEKLTGAFFVPPFLDQFLDAAATVRAGADLASMRLVLTGGRHLSARSVRRAQQRLGSVLHLYYATTETGINTMASPEELGDDPYSAGRCLPGITVRVLDPDTRREIPAGRLGLLAIDSRYALDQYVRHPLDTVTIGGRRHVVTSDYGYLGSMGQLYITARSSGQALEQTLDVVRTEGAIKESPAVYDACLTVLPGAGDEPPRIVAAVILDPSLPLDSRERALGHIRGLLDGGARGGEVVPVSVIPYNNAGKVSVPELRSMLTAPLGSA